MATHRAATSVRIADAVLAALDDVGAPYWSESGETDWVVPITTSRGTLPDFYKSELMATRVVVVPQGVEGVSHDRRAEQQMYRIGVAVLKSVGADAVGRQAELDQLAALVEQIQDFLTWDSQQILVMPAVMNGVVELQPEETTRIVLPYTLDPIFDPTTLRNEGVFMSVTNFNYYFGKVRG